METILHILLSPKGWLLLALYGGLFIATALFLLKRRIFNNITVVAFLASLLNIVPFFFDQHIDDYLINVSDRIAEYLPFCIFIFDFIIIFLVGSIISGAKR